ILICLGIVIIILGIFIKTNWYMLKLKYGIDSVVVWPGNIYDRYKENPNVDKQVFIEIKNKEVKELDIKISDIIYLPELEQISFGILYGNDDYKKENIPHKIFRVYLKNEEGYVYNEGGYVVTSGTFESYQRRWISGIDISNIKELTMYICSLEIDNIEIIEKKVATKLIYVRNTEKK
ncbi:MAG: hypothetical protein N4A63_15385, partial [Vallitalea sp.]|nr:hypothetical protein [Vallitalea sp.]